MKNIICERRIYDNRFNTHSHLYGQLILPIRGRLYIETERKKLELDNRKVYLPLNLEKNSKNMLKLS